MQSKSTQNVIAIILVISQLFVLLPFNAFAQEVPADVSASITEPAPTVETESAISDVGTSDITADTSTTDTSTPYVLS